MHSPAPAQLTSRATTLAVFAPFGNDPALSGYPDDRTRTALDHPIVAHLREVAATGVEVLLLIDRVDDQTRLVHIPGGNPGGLVEERQGKLDMLLPQTLADFVALAHRRNPSSQLVLTFEGHGAGFVPDLDATELARLKAAGDAPYEWREEGGLHRAYHRAGDRAGQPVDHRGAPVLRAGNPVLPGGNPTMPGGNPTMPGGHRVMSTWAIGEGLRASGAPRLAAIHFDNCFNLSVELLHTVASHAEVAAGYCNYNFFSAGEAYPAVFRRLAGAPDGASALQLGQWFVEENHRVLHAAGHEPTVAGAVELSRMRHIAGQVDALADALLEMLPEAGSRERPAAIARIRQAIVAAQQYDSDGDDTLGGPDELTDLDSLAVELMKIGDARVAAVADGLRCALSGIKQYGDTGSPWMAPDVRWDFASENLAMNIYLPDPLGDGVWDWRSQYYLNVNPDTTRPQPQRHVIRFLTETNWVDFLLEYHRDTPLVGLRPARLPRAPVLHALVDPRRKRVRTPGRERG